MERRETKKETEIQRNESAAIENAPIIDGELIEDAPESGGLVEAEKPKTELAERQRAQIKKPVGSAQAAARDYILLPFIFLIVTLLGGWRLSAGTNAFLFLKPPLICLILAAILLLLFFRVGLIKIGGWFSESFSALKNLARAVVLFTLFTASVQVFNSLLPEKGLPFWIIALLFLWTLWNNLFSVFDARRLLQSLGGLFGLAFVLKYLILASFGAASDATWTQKILEGVTREATFGLFDLPKFSAGTGYIQFFTLVFYLIALFLLKPETTESENVKM